MIPLHLNNFISIISSFSWKFSSYPLIYDIQLIPGLLNESNPFRPPTLSYKSTDNFDFILSKVSSGSIEEEFVSIL